MAREQALWGLGWVAFRVGDPTVGEDKAEGDKLREAFAQLDVAAIRKLLD